MKIEVGKFYKLRNGEIAGPVVVNKQIGEEASSIGESYPFAIDFPDGRGYVSYTVDGKCGYFTDEEYDNDIIADSSLTQEKTTTNPFLKTVTETRIVSAYHDLPNGLELFVEPRNSEVKIDLESGTWDKQSLAELARILNEISEAMV